MMISFRKKVGGLFVHIEKLKVFWFVATVSAAWFIPKYLVILAYEAMRNF